MFKKLSLIFIALFFLGACEKVSNEKLKKNEPEVVSKILIHTNKGDIVIGLYDKDAPATVKNFLTYVKDGFYNGLIFHRVVPNFVIQGGGFYPQMKKKAVKPPIKLEVSDKLKHKKWSVSMARTQNPDSATSQFFICLKDLPSLDNKYAVFGKVIKGFDVVEKISESKTGNFKYYRNVPKENIIILNMSLLN